MPELQRPFDVTKAVDFTDSQIASTWVDLSGGGFSEFANPQSPMPLLLLGGKGSGRTHLMRYHSYPLQKLRADNQDVLQRLRQDGYVGIYMQCEGLNAGRFEGKGQDAEAWATIFAYHMDLWLAQLALLTLGDAFANRDDLLQAEPKIAKGVEGLFDAKVTLEAPTLASTVDLLSDLRREVDLAVSNAALKRDLGDLNIRATRGRLVFGVPRVFLEHLPSLRGIQIVYLVDELENLTEAQQTYVNTLLREKQPPCTFHVGARLYGFRTRQTLSAGEENRQGSEFELVILDDQLRVDKRYDDFARDLVAQRLRGAGYQLPKIDARELRLWLDSLFEVIPPSPYEREATRFIDENYKAHERPHLTALRAELEEAMLGGAAPGLIAPPDVDEVVEGLTCVPFPLLEKLNIFLLYQDWSAGRDLLVAAREIRVGCQDLLAGSGGDRHKRALSHFKGDLLAQLLRRGRQPQRYAGLQAFIDISSGLPRHLLIVLKFVHRWALFYGERPFEGVPVSLRAQRSGVLQASNWFLEDAQATGSHSDAVKIAVEHLARFLHDLRFSAKPVESSLSTISLSESIASQRARDTLRAARNMSLLLRVPGGQKDRNDEGVVAKYQLNPMLCPRYDLPLARRGAVPLRADEVEAIFGGQPGFDRILANRLAAMNPPFRHRAHGKASGRSGHQGFLPEF